MNTGKFLKSFGYALRGIKTVLKDEFNARVHFLATLVVILLGITFKVTWLEWVILVLVIALVFALEMINTSIEGLADLYSQEYHPRIKKIKDVSAGAVLVAAMAALIVGCIIFLPKILGE